MYKTIFFVNDVASKSQTNSQTFIFFNVNLIWNSAVIYRNTPPSIFCSHPTSIVFWAPFYDLCYAISCLSTSTVCIGCSLHNGPVVLAISFHFFRERQFTLVLLCKHTSRGCLKQCFFFGACCAFFCCCPRVLVIYDILTWIWFDGGSWEPWLMSLTNVIGVNLSLEKMEAEVARVLCLLPGQWH